MLYLVISVIFNIFVIWIDIGYLLVEIYKFVEELIE